MKTMEEAIAEVGSAWARGVLGANTNVVIIECTNVEEEEIEAAVFDFPAGPRVMVYGKDAKTRVPAFVNARLEHGRENRERVMSEIESEILARVCASGKAAEA